MSKKTKTLYLVDVSSLFFRAYYAISNHLTSPKGLPTNALYGLLSMTDKFIKTHSAEYIVYCFDHKKPSFRKEIYSDYKANRGDMPEDLKAQIPYIKKLISFLGITMVEQEGYEADDLIGSLAVIAQKEQYKVIIVSGDKDFAQLVNHSVSLYDPMKEHSYDKEGVCQKWGVLPEQINDYLAIVGDSSDNIPGVQGIGPKGAKKLLQEYNNLENIYNQLDNIPPKMAEKLKNSKTNAFLSYKLARIVTDIHLDHLIPSFQKKPIQQKPLKELLMELGFKSFEKKLCGSTEKTKNILDKTQKQINNIDQKQKNNTQIKSKEQQPTQTQNNNTEKKSPEQHQKIKRLSSHLKLNYLSETELFNFIPPYGKVWFFTHKEQYFIAHKNKVISLENHNINKLGQNFSEKKVAWYGYDLKAIWKHFKCSHPIPHWCAMIASYLISSGPPGDFSSICSEHISEEITNSLTPGEVYNCHKNLQKKLELILDQLNMTSLYKNIELPLIAVLYEMELQGVALDLEELKEQASSTNARIKTLEKKIFEHTGYTFNISSTKQLADVLFTKIGLPSIKKTKTALSTDITVLSKLKDQHPIITLILEYRELFKLKTTYIDALPPLVNKKNHRIHTHFRQAWTTTGRLSSIHPNLQNIPIKTKRGQKVRKAFIAPPGKKIISADYSQIELRILAHITEDPGLCSAFKKDLDIHQSTASEIYSVPITEVTPNMRRTAKAVNFGLIYGQGPYTLSESLGISVLEAKDIINNYFNRFKKVKEYMDTAITAAIKKGYAETLFGRKRFIQELSNTHFHTKKWGERAAINTPIQGTASDLVKMAMIQLRNSLYSPLLLQIHDELLFECDDHLLKEETKYIKQIMENIVAWKVPLKVNIFIGQNWQVAH